jgi:HTH-type transcriptional regulator / antitoxin HigA
MRTEADFSPAWAVPPGRTVADLLTAKRISATAMATSMGWTSEELDDLIEGNTELTAPIAARLAEVVGASPTFWLRREERYREHLASLTNDIDPKDESYKAWLKSLPLRQMIEFGWIEDTDDKKAKLRKCLDFFGVPNLDAWKRTYGEVRSAAAFRTTDAHVESEPATAAWLRQGEVLSDKVDCAEWNPAAFESKLSEIKQLTIVPSPSDFLPRLRALCAEAGVAVVIVRAPPGCRASGATFFSTPTKAVLLLSFRYLSDDQFWFSFFHEAAHLVLHYDVESLILETTIDGPKSPLEAEANQFAAEHLIPPALQKKMRAASKSRFEIGRLAREAGVSIGIVVGQMQHRGYVKREHYNKFKVRYQLTEIC